MSKQYWVWMKLGSGGDLLGQAQRPPVERLHKRIGRRAQEEPGRRGQLAAAEENAFVAHDARRAQQLDGVEVKDALRFRLVPGGDVVAGDAEDVVHAHRRRAEQIALNGDAVAVAAGDLEDRFVAGAHQQGADGHAGHVAVRAGGIDGVDAVAHAGQHEGGRVDVFRVGAVGRVQFGGDGKAAGAQDALQPAFGE